MRLWSSGRWHLAANEENTTTWVRILLGAQKEKNDMEKEMENMFKDIKKSLMKQKPQATLQIIEKGALQYKTAVIASDMKMYIVNIAVPVNEIDAVSKFRLHEEGNLLSRYVKSFYELQAKF